MNLLDILKISLRDTLVYFGVFPASLLRFLGRFAPWTDEGDIPYCQGVDFVQLRGCRRTLNRWRWHPILPGSGFCSTASSYSKCFQIADTALDCFYLLYIYITHLESSWHLKDIFKRYFGILWCLSCKPSPVSRKICSSRMPPDPEPMKAPPHISREWILFICKFVFKMFFN